MTDRTTELREKMDELGIEHTDASYKRKVPITVWRSNGATFCFMESSNQIDLHIENPTPEQAIAATLGSEREKALEKLVQYALDEGHIDEWWYADALKLGLEANY